MDRLHKCRVRSELESELQTNNQAYPDMIVLSLFDGMSCGQIALRDMGIPVTRYYASEIDKWAIQQTQLNFPDTVQLKRC